MENFKFILFSIIILAIVGYGGYWAFSTIESGSDHISNEKQRQLEQANEDLIKKVSDLERQVSLLEVEKESQLPKEEVVNTEEPPVTIQTTTTPVKATTYKYQSLIDDLQKLVDGNIFLKSKSQGIAVGTVQNFLNIYFNTKNKIDNDYGPSTITAVKNFQKAQGLTADGEAGVGTFKKMISWLKTK